MNPIDRFNAPRVVMPVHYCKDDRRNEDWIRDCLYKLPDRFRRQAAIQYSHIFITAQEQEPISYKKQNKGIRAANLWLLRQVKRYESLQKAETSQPLKAS